MKRHDVCNPSPDTRYPAHERSVILWLDGGEWTEGWYDEKRGRWIEAHTCTTQFNVIAWSDPTEPDSAEPVAWALTSKLFGGPRPLTAYNNRQLAEDVAAAIDPSLQVVPLYATPPDTTAVMRQAAEAMQELTACKDLKDHAEGVSFAGPLSEFGDNWEREYNRMRLDYIRRQPLAWEAIRAALSALRGAMGEKE